MKITHALGIDPGKEGGWAFGKKGTVLEYGKMPLVGGDIYVGDLAEKIVKFGIDRIIVIIEKVASRPGQGVSSVFTFGTGYGTLLGMCQTLRVRHDKILPQIWKKVVLAGTAKDKDAAMDYVTRIYPEVQLVPEGCRVPHDGIADAVCLMDWGLQKYA